MTDFGKELETLSDGDNITGEKVANIPKDRTVTYAHDVIDYFPLN